MNSSTRNLPATALAALLSLGAATPLQAQDHSAHSMPMAKEPVVDPKAKPATSKSPVPVDHAAMDHSAMDQGAMDHSQMNHAATGMEPPAMQEMDHSGMDHGQMSQTDMPMNHADMDHSQMNHEAPEE